MARLNIDLLNKVRDKIAATPEAYDQRDWCLPSHAAPCGTVACIAGWAAILSGEMSIKEAHRNYSDNGEHVNNVAMRVLGLTENEANTLFNGGRDGWPLRYRALGKLSDSQAAIRYLNRIINTGKVT